jgi:hypothetical protein
MRGSCSETSGHTKSLEVPESAGFNRSVCEGVSMTSVDAFPFAYCSFRKQWPRYILVSRINRGG